MSDIKWETAGRRGLDADAFIDGEHTYAINDHRPTGLVLVFHGNPRRPVKVGTFKTRPEARRAAERHHKDRMGER